MTSQSLFYLGSEDPATQIPLNRRARGTARCQLQLKLLQSDGKLSLIATGKESALAVRQRKVRSPRTGRLDDDYYSSELDPELLNRCLVVAVDEDRAQTRAIHAAQLARENTRWTGSR